MVWYVAESGVAYNFFWWVSTLGGRDERRGKWKQQKKKNESKKAKKRGEERKRKEKVNTAVSLLNQNPNFAFCACPNVEGSIYETEGRKVYDL